MSIGRPILAELVNRRMQELNLSTNEVARRSGNAISNGTVWNIQNNRVKDVKEETLLALAKALEISEDEVFNAYRGKDPEPMTRERFFAELMALGVEDFHAAKGVMALTPADMEEILAVIRSTAKTMVEQKIKARKKK